MQLVSFIAGEGDKAVAGQRGGVRPPREGTGDSFVTLAPPPQACLHPLPGCFNTGGSARPGRWFHIQLVPLRLILSEAGFGEGGCVYFGDPPSPL